MPPIPSGPVDVGDGTHPVDHHRAGRERTGTVTQLDEAGEMLDLGAVRRADVGDHPDPDAPLVRVPERAIDAARDRERQGVPGDRGEDLRFRHADASDQETVDLGLTLQDGELPRIGSVDVEQPGVEVLERAEPITLEPPKSFGGRPVPSVHQRFGRERGEAHRAVRVGPEKAEDLEVFDEAIRLDPCAWR